MIVLNYVLIVLSSALYLLRRYEHTNRSRPVLGRSIDNKPQS